MSIPEKHRAIVRLEHAGEAGLVEKNLPVVKDDEILIKVQAVTLNPTDWKHVEGALKPGQSTGSDFAGDVVFVGSQATTKGVHVGDAVAGYTRGGALDGENGAFQEYLKMYPELVWHIPKTHLTYEQAAPMGGISLSTAVQALYQRLQLPPPWAPAEEAFPILIWAGSTSVGIYAIKLAKMSGLTVATTASPKNHELLKKLGADAVFDYRDPEAGNLIKAWSQGKIKHGLDTISEQGSIEMAAKAFGSEGGKLVTLLPYKGSKYALGPVSAEVTLVYSALNKDNNADFEAMADWYKRLPEYASQLNVMPLTKWSEGFEGLPSAMKYLKEGNVSAGKISVVY